MTDVVKNLALPLDFYAEPNQKKQMNKKHQELEDQAKKFDSVVNAGHKVKSNIKKTLIDDPINQMAYEQDLKTGKFSLSKYTNKIDPQAEKMVKVEKLMDKITNCICNEINAEPSEIYPHLDHAVIFNMINNSFYSSSKNKFYFISYENFLLDFTRNTIKTHMIENFGHPAKTRKLGELVATKTRESYENLGEDMIKEKIREVKKQVLSIPFNSIINFIMFHNQRNYIQRTVDMYAQSPRIEMDDYNANIIMPHKEHQAPFIKDYMSQAVIEDYKEHFEELDDFLDFLAASLFAADRKHFYLWMRCHSDWGKGYLSSILKELKISTALTVEQLTTIVKGNNAGIKQEDFIGRYALIVNEFKKVTSSIKELESDISMTPKYGISTEIPLFTKIFFSKDNVPSLIMDGVIDDQFSNRFSYIEKTGKINDRPLFKELGSKEYMQHLKVYFADYLNKTIKTYQALDPIEASKRAEKMLDYFRTLYSIENKFSKLSDESENIAEDFKRWAVNKFTGDRNGFLFQDGGFYYLKSASKMFGEFVKETIDESAQIGFKKAKDEFLKMACHDKKGIQPKRFPWQRTQIKVLKFKLETQEN